MPTEVVVLQQVEVAHLLSHGDLLHSALVQVELLSNVNITGHNTPHNQLNIHLVSLIKLTLQINWNLYQPGRFSCPCSCLPVVSSVETFIPMPISSCTSILQLNPGLNCSCLHSGPIPCCLTLTPVTSTVGFLIKVAKKITI